MDLFEEYLVEYDSNIVKINKHLDELDQTAPGDPSFKTCKLIDQLFSENENTLKQMDIEARTLSSSKKKECIERLIQLKQALTELNNTYQRKKEKSQRTQLMGKKSTEDRNRMLDNNEK